MSESLSRAKEPMSARSKRVASKGLELTCFVAERLIGRCPWPNATGLLVNTFRREIDRASRCASNLPSPVGVTEKESNSAYYCAQGHPSSPLVNGDGNELDRTASVDTGSPSDGVDAPG